MSTASYIDKNGEKKSGIIAAEDEIGYWEKLENHYKDLYESQVESNNTAAAEATARTLRQIGEQIDALNESFRESNRALYRGFRDAGRKLPQQLAAAGITGGLSESSQLKLRSGYEESLGEAERSRRSAEAALRLKALETESEEKNAAEKKNAEALKTYQSNTLSLTKERRSALAKEADAMAETGDFSLYAGLGYSSEEIAAMRSAWEEKNPKLAMAVAAKTESYTAAEVAQLSAHLAQYYLQALGYSLKNSGVWDSATEKAYRAHFGVRSGRR